MRLVSITYKLGWEPMRAFQAHCWLSLFHNKNDGQDRHPGKHAPAVGCQCGIYGTKHPSQCRNWAGLRVSYQHAFSHLYRGPDNRPGLPVFGRIKMWGHVVKHTGGYKSEFAYPSCLYIPVDAEGEPAPDQAEEYLVPYGVPVEHVTINDLFENRV